MSGLAKIMLSMGHKVSGSDHSFTKEVENLKKLKVKVHKSHDENNITKDIDLLVYSGAIKTSNPEIIRAKSLGIKCIERSQFLGQVSKYYQSTIAISGTHGKTTTTAMIGEIFCLAGLNPTVHLGGESVNLKTNTLIGGNGFFIVEACEYRESFRYLKNELAVITNIECDHMDYYKNFRQIEKSFCKFARNSKVLIKHKDVNVNHSNLIVVGDDWTADDIVLSKGGFDYKVYYKSTFFAKIRLNMLGRHNITNSLYAIATAYQYKIPKDIIVDGLRTFQGVGRRYETIGTISKTPVIIDYAHHPTEIDSSIKGIIEEYASILVVFQPHTYSRTLKLFDDFIKVFKNTTHLVLFETYSAREQEIDGGRAIDLYNSMSGQNVVYYTEKLDVLMDLLEKENQTYNFDAILVLGAGDLADKLKNTIKKGETTN